MIKPLNSSLSGTGIATEVARTRNDAPTAQDFAGQTPFERAVGRTPAHTPEWTNHNDGDPGVTLLEVPAFLADGLHYRDAEWKYVNVRRYIATLEQSIEKGLEWAVFEPNAEPLWARARAAVSDILMRDWQSGALQGARPEEAFFVRCDRTTMTQDDIDNGRLVLQIGIATVKPAEFVILRFSTTTSGKDD